MTVPSFFTEQENMIAASFCPFRMRSAVSMRLIKASGPVPSKIGRYIGNFAVCDDGTSTCDHTGSIIKTTARIARTRMGRYATETQKIFNRKYAVKLGYFR